MHLQVFEMMFFFWCSIDWLTLLSAVNANYKLYRSWNLGWIWIEYCASYENPQSDAGGQAQCWLSS